MDLQGRNRGIGGDTWHVISLPKILHNRAKGAGGKSKPF
jgi:hypothetical protein